MIAHRLQTIETAQNLLYIENSKNIIPAEKGTPEYDDIIQRLKTETYKHQESGDKKATASGNAVQNGHLMSGRESNNDVGSEMSPSRIVTAQKTNNEMPERSTASPLLKLRETGKDDFDGADYKGETLSEGSHRSWSGQRKKEEKEESDIEEKEEVSDA